VTGVNDIFVMDAWTKAAGVTDEIEVLADGNGDFAKALGLTMDGSGHGLGLRSQRYAMVVEDGVVTSSTSRTRPPRRTSRGPRRC
jgi:peroxiredoxin